MSALAILILQWMISLQPPAVTPWRDTYADTAEAIAEVVEHEEPLFEDDADRVKTASLLVAVAFTEGRFDPHAVGDHGRAHGAWQVHASEYAPEAASPAFLDDVGLQARVALRMLRTSLKACRARDADARLSWYTSGTCDRGGNASRYRMSLAKRIARVAPAR